MAGGKRNDSKTQLENLVKKAAHEAGFDLVGIAPVREFDELDRFGNGSLPDTPAR